MEKPGSSSMELIEYKPEDNRYNHLLDLLYSLINQEEDDLENSLSLNHRTKLLEITQQIEVLQQEQTHLSHLEHFQQFSNITLVNSGGFGIVFKGTHRLDNQLYALKLIPIKMLINEKIKTLLLSKIREIRYLAKLDHPNIVRYYNSWIDINNTANLYHYLSHHDIDLAQCSYELSTDSCSSEILSSSDTSLEVEFNENSPNNYLIKQASQVKDNLVDENHLYKYAFLSIQMEFMDFTLKKWISGQPSLASLYDVLSGLLNGLEYLHNQHPPIIHCDIKPDNILVKQSKGVWVAKLADFGLVSELDGIWKPAPYEGTTMYKAPELNKVSPTPAADIYSLGIVLYEIKLKYTTEMERIRLLTDFKKGKIKTKTILDLMINEDPNTRPSIREVKDYVEKLLIPQSKVS